MSTKDYPAKIDCIKCGFGALLGYFEGEGNCPVYICPRCGVWFIPNTKEIHPLKTRQK